MSIRNLDLLFHPRSLAVIGASNRPGTVGNVLVQNLFAAGFDGPIYPVTPTQHHVRSVVAYRDIESLPMTPDLAVIATPPNTVPALVRDLAARGTKAAVVITAGFGEGGHEQGARLRQEMLDAARPHLMRIVGPNCLGIMVPGAGLNASFGNVAPEPGKLAFVAQSGAVISSIVDWAASRKIGFSYLVSLGSMSDVDFGDMLDYLANDPGTTAILLYVETITNARKFMSAARAAARMKPVVVVKAGRHAEGARAAASHTGAMAGSDEVYDAAFRRAGILRVLSIGDLFEAVETLALARRPKGDRLAIVTNGGGMGVLAIDALIDATGRPAELAPETIERLNSVLPATWSGANPVDIIGDAPGKRYADALDAVLADDGVDGVLVLHCPTAIASGTEAAKAVIERVQSSPGIPVLTAWVGEKSEASARELFIANKVATYQTPVAGVRAFMQLVSYRRGQDALMQTPPSIPEDFKPDREATHRLISTAIQTGREWLNEAETKSVLDAYGVPVVTTRIVRDQEGAVRAAEAIGGKVVLKVLSPDILHKSDVGGVVLNLDGPAAVREAAERMIARISDIRPDARIEGFTVQEMVHRPHAHELLIGAVEDAQFGPVVMFGQGGTAVEILADKALELPPLNMTLAHSMMARTRVHKLLEGYRDRAAADLDAIALTLIKIAQLITDHPEIVELDINPLLADEAGVIALDARVKVVEPERPGTERMAIRPYPSELEHRITLFDEREMLLRPIVPEDASALQRAFASLTPDEIRMRFMAPLKAIGRVQLARFTQIDYDREMALVLTEPGRPGTTDIHAVVRISADPDMQRAEYAIIVHHEISGHGIGTELMRRMIDYARSRGIGEIFGDVLRENGAMLTICDELGFSRHDMTDEPGIVRVVLRLDGSLRSNHCGENATAP